MGKWLEISIEEDRYGNCINREERVDVIIDILEEDNYIPPTYKDSHYITKTSTYFYKKTYCQYMTFYYKIIEAVYIMSLFYHHNIWSNDVTYTSILDLVHFFNLFKTFQKCWCKTSHITNHHLNTISISCLNNFIGICHI